MIAPPRTRGLAAADVPRIAAQARHAAAMLHSVSQARLYAAMSEWRARWGRHGDDRRAFLASHPEQRIGVSAPMIEWAIDRFCHRLDPERAQARAALQLFAGRDDVRAMLRAEPLGVVLLVVSGNVFTGPAEALLASLCTRNAAIVKRPSGPAGEFVDAFVDSIVDVAPDLAAAATLVAWKGGSDEVERPLAESVDAILIAGDLETIAGYRRRAPASVPLIEFGPRASVAVISRRGMAALDIDLLARDVALWDQLACSAAQNVYVQGDDQGRPLAEQVSAALARLEATLPPGTVSIDERIEVARCRHEAAFAASQGHAHVFFAGDALATVVYERAPDFRPSPLRRVVRVKPYRALDDLTQALQPARHLLQTVGLAVAADERASYEEALCAAGARRLCAIGAMNEPGADLSHDGVLDLQRLVRWVQLS